MGPLVWALMAPLVWALLGRPVWALMGWALLGPLGPSKAGPSWAALDWTLMGPPGTYLSEKVKKVSSTNSLDNVSLHVLQKALTHNKNLSTSLDV
jgi:hypothetical protein